MLGFALAVFDADPEPDRATSAIPARRPRPHAIAVAGGRGRRAARSCWPWPRRRPRSQPRHRPRRPPRRTPRPRRSRRPSWPRPVVAESVMPVVPVAGFWSKADGLKRSQIKRALAAGELKGYRRIVVEKRIAEALATELGIELHDDVRADRRRAHRQGREQRRPRARGRHEPRALHAGARRRWSVAPRQRSRRRCRGLATGRNPRPGAGRRLGPVKDVGAGRGWRLVHRPRRVRTRRPRGQGR